MSANPTNPGKPGFSPGKPAVYTPQPKKPGISEAVKTEPDHEQSDSTDTRPGAPARPDIPDRSNPPLPVDLMTGETVSDEEDTKDMVIEQSEEFASGDRSTRPPMKTTRQHGEDRRPER